SASGAAPSASDAAGASSSNSATSAAANSAAGTSSSEPSAARSQARSSRSASARSAPSGSRAASAPARASSGSSSTSTTARIAADLPGSAGVTTQLLMEPSPGQRPFPRGRPAGHTQRFGGFHFGESGKEPAFHHSREPRVDLRQPLERLIQCDQRVGPL